MLTTTMIDLEYDVDDDADADNHLNDDDDVDEYADNYLKDDDDDDDVFLSLIKGILPPLLAETPKRAVKFFTFEQYKMLFSFGKPQPDAVALTLAGLGCGLTEAFVINPFEVRRKISRNGLTDARTDTRFYT